MEEVCQVCKRGFTTLRGLKVHKTRQSHWAEGEKNSNNTKDNDAKMEDKNENTMDFEPSEKVIDVTMEDDEEPKVLDLTVEDDDDDYSDSSESDSSSSDSLSDSESSSEEEEKLRQYLNKRKRQTTKAKGKGKEKKKPAKKMKINDIPEEKRLARWRSSPSRGVSDRIHRAKKERLFLITRCEPTKEDIASFTRRFVVLGSVGNVYDIEICRQPSCSCPDHAKGNLCKHILFVLLKVLRVASDSPLIYQQALLPSELQRIFDAAPSDPSATVLAAQTLRNKYAEITGETVEVKDQAAEAAATNKRKPIEGDCPICYEEMKPSEAIVFCETSCGNNVHKQCFDNWAGATRRSGGKVTCVYCRAEWTSAASSSSSKSKKKGGPHMHEGFLNLAAFQPGVREERPYYEPYHWRKGYYY